MADILSTLRELRSLEEKRAHGTLSPADEQRFQDLQASVTSRGPKPGPVTPPPVAPTPAPVAAPPPEEPPFVDADLTEDATEVRLEPTVVQPMAAEPMIAEPMVAEPTVIQAAPPELASAEPLLTEPSPSEPLLAEPVTAEAQKSVLMSPAELRQWNASFAPVEAATAVAPAPTSDTPPPAATDWLAPTPLDATPESGAPAGTPAPLAGTPAPLAGTPAPLAEQPTPLDTAGAETVPESAAPEPTAVDDAPMLWSEPTPAEAATPAPSPEAPLLDDGWSVSVAGGTPEATASDAEPTRLTQASPSMDPTLADAYEPAPEVQRSNDSSSGVTSKRMTPIGEAFAAGESRVVVHMLGGAQKRGSLVDAHMNADFLELRLPDGEKEMLSTAALKAVFFVVPIGQDVPKPVGDPVTVTLQDGHQLTGLSPDYQVGAVGFFLCPTDQRSRTAKIYIYAGAVKGIS